VVRRHIDLQNEPRRLIQCETVNWVTTERSTGSAELQCGLGFSSIQCVTIDYPHSIVVLVERHEFSTIDTQTLMKTNST